MTPVFSTNETGEPLAQKNRAPILPAYRHGKNNLWVFCKFCGFFHVHGNTDGLRVPHCGFRNAKENYPHEYYIRDTGEPVTKEMRRLDRIGHELYERNLAIASGFRRPGKQLRFDNRAEAEKFSSEYWEKRGTCSNAILREILSFGILGETYPFASGKS